MLVLLPLLPLLLVLVLLVAVLVLLMLPLLGAVAVDCSTAECGLRWSRSAGTPAGAWADMHVGTCTHGGTYTHGVTAPVCAGFVTSYVEFQLRTGGAHDDRNETEW